MPTGQSVTSCSDEWLPVQVPQAAADATHAGVYVCMKDTCSMVTEDRRHLSVELIFTYEVFLQQGLW